MDNTFFNFNPIITEASEKALEKAKNAFARIDEMTEYNQHKVLNAFIENRVSETQLWGSTGYGYGDSGRELADKIVADVFGAEDAIIRYSIACGTHALGIALFALFIGLLVPKVKSSWRLVTLVCFTGLLNAVLTWILPDNASSWAIIISCVLGALVGVFFVKDEEVAS